MPRFGIARAIALASAMALISCDGEGVAPAVGSFNLSSVGFPASAAQGGGAVGTLLVNRVDGHSASVTLTASGMPDGVGVAIGSAPAASPATSISLTVGALVATGSYLITISGAAAGSTLQTTQVTLVVVAPAATASVSMLFCTVPQWFAYKNEGYLWQVVTTPANGVFTFQATAAPIVAYVNVATGAVNESIMTVLYATLPELGAQDGRDCAGSRSVNGSVSGATTGQSTRISLGARTTTATAANPNFGLSAVADRVLDLVATKGVITATQNNLQVTPDVFVLQRALNPAAGSSLGTLDFSGQGIVPTSTQLTVANVASGDFMSVGNTFWTNTNTYGVLHTFQPTTPVNTLYSMPAARFTAGDMHELFVETFQSGFLSGRYNIAYLGALSDRTETLGPVMATPAIETISTAPYVRLRGLLPVQPEYPTAARFLFYQAGGLAADRLVYVVATAGYLGATPAATWSIAIPVFGPVAGLNNAWLPSSTKLEYQAEAYSGPGRVLFGGVPTTGDLVKVAYFAAPSGAVAPAGAALRASPRRRVQPGQYFRR